MKTQIGGKKAPMFIHEQRIYIHKWKSEQLLECVKTTQNKMHESYKHVKYKRTQIPISCIISFIKF